MKISTRVLSERCTFCADAALELPCLRGAGERSTNGRRGELSGERRRRLARSHEPVGGRVSMFAKKLLGVGAATALLGVLLGLYVAALGNQRTAARRGDHTACLERRHAPDARDRRRDRAQVQPRASRLGLLPRHEQRQVDPQHDLQGARQLGRPRHHLPVRLAHRPAQPVPLAGPGHDRRHDDSRRQDSQLDPPRRNLAHVRRPPAGRVRAAAGRARRSQEPVRIRALRRCRDTARSTFSFRTGKKGRYRWQCFVPCAAGFLYGTRRADADGGLHGRFPDVV